jgi:uncharacterized protein
MVAKAEVAPQVHETLAEDRMKAWVTVAVDGRRFTPPRLDDVLAALLGAKIVIDEPVRGRVAAVIAQCTAAAEAAARQGAPPELPKGFLVAEGQAPRDALDGQFEWAPELDARRGAASEAGHIDYFAKTSIVTVPAGTPIGRALPPQPPVVGKDVCGATQPPRKTHSTELKLGHGVARGEDGQQLVARVGGRIMVEPGSVRICDLIDINGDVDFESGSVDACVDVAVHGTVRANFTVQTTGELHVDKVIEAADVVARGDIYVRGGIFGRDGSHTVASGGQVTAQLLNEARVNARRDLRINKEVLNSTVYTEGHLYGERGTIIGGAVYAREGVQVRTIGSDANVTTHVSAGTHVNTLRRIRQLEHQIQDLHKSAEQIREAVQPLIANLKRLMPAQRERATELLAKADEIETGVEQLQAEIQQLLAAGSPRGTPAICAAEAVYPGTQLVLEGREVRIGKVMHGPVRFELRKVHDVTELVAVNQRTGSVFTLPALDVDLEQPPGESVKLPPIEEQS